MAGKHKRLHRRRHRAVRETLEPAAPGALKVSELPFDEENPEDVFLQDSQVTLSVPMERLLRVVESIPEADRLSGPEDIEKFLAEFSEERYNAALAALRASSDQEAAQQLAYDALLDAETDEEAVALARRALELDPDCVDARMILAECNFREHIEGFLAEVEDAVATGERSLGAEFFKEQTGGMWDALDARPYLRARHRLADALRLNGRVDDGVAHLEALLELDPLDHQRARELLLACYLAGDRLDEARRVLLAYPLDDSAVFHWTRVIERFCSKDPSGAYRELKKANEQNPHAEAYLTFSRKPPAEMPDTYLPGDADEAVHCLYILGMAMAAHQELILWIRDLRAQGWN